MELTDFRASGSVVISAPPETLYDFIADMPSVGQVSPVCVGGEWETGDRGVGATFIGTNTTPDRTWQARMRVTVAEPHREISWNNLGSASLPLTDDLPPSVRWRYVFTPVADGTKVDESWQVLETASGRFKEMSEEDLRGLEARTQSSIDQTLENLKQLFES